MFATRTQWNQRANRLTQAMEAHRFTGKTLFDLTSSNPTNAGFSYDARAIGEAFASPQGMQYDPQPLGLPTARHAVAEYYAELLPTKIVPPEHILLTTSTSEAYSFCFRLLCNPGDEVLAPQPSYPLFDYLATLQDVSLRPYGLIYDHGWQIDFDSLRRALSSHTRAVLVVHPNNPTGSYVKSWELEELNTICAERKIAIISDEVFLDFALDAPHESLANNEICLTFALSGLSKISALPQMKVAWMAASGPEARLREAMARLEIISDTYLSVSTPQQVATPVLLHQRFAMQRQIKERVRANLAELDKQVAGSAVASRLRVEGGWYAVLRVPATSTDEEISVRLLEEQSVLVHPGHFYDFAAPGYLVLSLITPPAEFTEGIGRLLRWLR